MTPTHFSNEIGDSRHATRNANDIHTATQTFRCILQLAIAGVLIGALLREPNLPSAVIGLCVVLLLWLIIKTNATPLLVTFQLILFFREPNRPGMEDELGSVVYVAVVLGLLMFLSRNQSLKGLIGRTLTELVKTFSGTPDKAPRSIAVQPDRPTRNASRRSDSPTPTTIVVQPDRPPALPTSHQATSLFRQMVLLLVCVLLSQLLLTIFGIAGGIAEQNPSVTRAEQLLKPVPPLLIITVVAVIVTSELAWRRLTAGQSSMYLRSTQVLLLYADIRMVVKRRLSFLRREKPSPTTTATWALPSFLRRKKANTHDRRK